MECKLVPQHFPRDLHLELIDTLWNVNYQSLEAFCRLQTELIDTLWNVNEDGKI